MKVIGLTGNSGCGKGAVASVMAEQGALILDCDKIAHENMMPWGAAYSDIVTAFGKDILKSDGEIDRKVLGSVVFNDRDKLELLNTVTHKYITEEVKRRIGLNEDKKCIVIDAPLLIEAGLDKICDRIWAVYAPLETRIKRVMSRDNIDRESVILRFKNQMKFEDIAKIADVVINNDGDLEELRKKVLKFMNDEELI